MVVVTSFSCCSIESMLDSLLLMSAQSKPVEKRSITRLFKHFLLQLRLLLMEVSSDWSFFCTLPSYFSLKLFALRPISTFKPSDQSVNISIFNLLIVCSVFLYFTWSRMGNYKMISHNRSSNEDSSVKCKLMHFIPKTTSYLIKIKIPMPVNHIY